MTVRAVTFDAYGTLLRNEDLRLDLGLLDERVPGERVVHGNLRVIDMP